MSNQTKPNFKEIQKRRDAPLFRLDSRARLVEPRKDPKQRTK